MSIIRSQHWTDRPNPDDLRIGRRRRTIKNWSNYRTPGNDWAETRPGVGAPQGAPPDWVGAYDFSLSSLEGPLQIFARDAMDVGNRAMVGYRSSETPGAWMNLKALDVNAVDAVVSGDGLKITYPGLWDGCDLVYDVGGHTLKETVEIWDKSIAPLYFEWTIKTPPQYELTIGDNRFDLGGIIESRAPVGWDSAMVGGNIDGTQPIGLTYTEQDLRTGLRVVRLTPNPDDMANAIGTVTLDPTTTISGTTDIDDGTLIAFWADRNSGVDPKLSFQSGTTKFIIRANDSAIPEGVYTKADLNLYTTFVRGYSMYRILPVNAGWGEGRGLDYFTALAGEYTRDSARHTIQLWASSFLGTAGLDYTTTGSITGTTTTGVFNKFDLTPFFSSWSDGTYANAGVLFVGTSGSTGDFVSTDGTSNQPWYDLEYTAAASGGRSHSIASGIGRGIGRGIG